MQNDIAYIKNGKTHTGQFHQASTDWRLVQLLTCRHEEGQGVLERRKLPGLGKLPSGEPVPSFKDFKGSF